MMPTDKQLEMLVEYSREVIATYEKVVLTGDWVSLSPPIVHLRAVMWRIDGVITDAQDRLDAGLS
jgi:hypothetical protein